MWRTTYTSLLFVILTGLFGKLVIPNECKTTVVNLESDPLASLEFNLAISDDQSLENISLAITKFIKDIEDIIDEVNVRKAIFLENLESSKISKLLHMFSEPPCVSNVHLNDLKESFRIRLGIHEANVRGSISELQDRVSHIMRISALEKIACHLMANSSYCSQNSVLRLNPKVSSYPSLTKKEEEIPSEKHNPKIFSPSRPNITWNFIPTVCLGGNFRCLDGSCINFQYACDGSKDCPDGTDEREDCVRDCTGVRCRNLKCITESEICNEIDDCGDGTDEETCFSKETCSLEVESFACKSRKECLSLVGTCDGRPDCSDASDEGGLCESVEGCVHCFIRGGSCLRLPTGPICLSECPRGFFVHLENGLCEQSSSLRWTAVSYQDTSFRGVVNKLKLLVNRFSNGFILLRKYVDQELIRSTLDLKKCVSSLKQYHSPFEIKY